MLPTDSERRRLVNFARAESLMASRGVDALVAAQPVNVYYLSNFWTVLQKMGFEFASLAMTVRGHPERDALVASAAQIWRLANDDLDFPPQVFACTGPANWREWLEAGGTPAGSTAALVGAPATPWPSRPEAELSRIEQAWAQASRRIAGHEAPTSIHGMARALTEAGLARGRIATDDPRLGPLLAQAGLDGLRVECDPNLFRRLRVVKSDAEIALMRIAARNNADAAIAMARAIEPGMTMREIESAFGVETARRGSESVFVVAGGTGYLPHGRIVRGQPFLIDAVSRYRWYHGDFGRTVIVGEPDAATRRRVEALRVGWRAAFEALRPGRRYEQVRAAAFEAMRRDGYGDVMTVAHPHSVGLQHTDEPFRDGLPFDVKDDLVLEENMTLTVDFPHIELGWGAAHLEDLVRVTRDGAEPLAAMDDPLIVV
jgi:Xaa-Pro aminopeptidase